MAAEVVKQLSYSNVVQQDGGSGVRGAEMKAPSVPESENVPNHSESKENVKPVEHNNAQDDVPQESGEERTTSDKPIKKVSYVPASPPKDNPWLRNKKASANTTTTTTPPPIATTTDATSSGQQTAAAKSQKQPDKNKTQKSPRNNKVAHGSGAGGGHREKSSGRGRPEKHEAPKDDASKVGKKDSTESKPPPRKKVYESAPPPKVNAWSKVKTTPVAAPPPPVFNSDVNMTSDVVEQHSTDIGKKVVEEPSVAAAVLPTTNAAPPAPSASVTTPVNGRSHFQFFISSAL